MNNQELDQRIQKLADLLVDIVWTEDDILQTPQNVTTVNAVKKYTDPVETEFLNYGSR